MRIRLFHDSSQSAVSAQRFQSESVLKRLEMLDAKAHRIGLDSLNTAKNDLIALGMETDADGRVTKNGYGVFNLTWQAAKNPQWATQVASELDEIRQGIRNAHKAPLQFLIWAGMGGSAEDKAAYLGAGLLRRGPRCYILDSTDPAKLRHILDDVQARSGLDLKSVLERSLIVGMALGMTSYEPVVNLRALAALYDHHHIDSRANFCYLTLDGSLLDQFGKERGYRRVGLQLDGRQSTAGRHSAPMTRGSLYPIGLGKNDLAAWIKGAALSADDVKIAFELASFLDAQSLAGRDKVTLLLPKPLAGAALWTKQAFEESLGKSEELGIKIIIDEPVKLNEYHSPKDAAQDRIFLGISTGSGSLNGEKIKALKRAGYPIAIVDLGGAWQLSGYFQFIHYTVFGIAYLRKMNFVTQPSVELYKAITNQLFAEAKTNRGLEHTAAWQSMINSPRQIKWKGGVTLFFDRLTGTPDPAAKTAPAVFASLVLHALQQKQIEYFELTFFGDTRYSKKGRDLNKCLHHAAGLAFRKPLKMPVDVYEGPAMNHSYHEMIIGHGRCFSIVILSSKEESIPEANHTAEYHRAQFLATQIALAERNRSVASILLRDLEPTSIRALSEFFREVGIHLKSELKLPYKSREQ